MSTILDVVCQTTGMGFAAIARVTEDKWIACSVRDDISFGLKPGGELLLKTTICNEIRYSGEGVIIDHVSEDPLFKDHHTPAMYGFESYISVPIIRKDGSFFGTLCAIDPVPHALRTPAVMGMFDLFSELISFHLDTQHELALRQNYANELETKIREHTLDLEQKNSSLVKANQELQAFTYITSHDLQEPLRKIRTFVSIIEEREIHNLSESGKHNFSRLNEAAERMQTLISDLLSYSRTDLNERKFEMADLNQLLSETSNELREELALKKVKLVVNGTGCIPVIAFQFRQLLYNILSNAMKFSSPSRLPEIAIDFRIAPGKDLTNDQLQPELEYCHIRFSDNGIGFDPAYNEKIFELFQQLNASDKHLGTGIGLAIVKKIVENHHGVISANGKMGEGAEFDVFIPVVAVEE